MNLALFRSDHPSTLRRRRRPLAEPVAWFIFADALQAQFPALLAVATAIALDVLAGPEGDTFAVRRDAVLGRVRPVL
ncbi:hypothetical protein E2562_008079 [Oryza meyeriana var. granulata]|uniref:Uncharacterized protein n=1 Tax=Oryza meyeriana var. granulata TaxID=110450 RepID=A0A6G1CEM0_9ORYZ|nr:hypothetical protein E2562_008079 [Oryza meyeriana var. granulata]